MRWGSQDRLEALRLQVRHAKHGVDVQATAAGRLKPARRSLDASQQLRVQRALEQRSRDSAENAGILPLAWPILWVLRHSMRTLRQRLIANDKRSYLHGVAQWPLQAHIVKCLDEVCEELGAGSGISACGVMR